MKTKHRWLNAAIKFAAANTVDMPWAPAANRNTWRVRCAARAKSKS